MAVCTIVCAIVSSHLHVFAAAVDGKLRYVSLTSGDGDDIWLNSNIDACISTNRNQRFAQLNLGESRCLRCSE